MTQFCLILHFYQPPTQSLSLTEEILRTCYLPLCDLLLNEENARVSLNISGSLLLQTQAIPDHDLNQKLRRLAESGKVDFLNSPIFHPISPLTPQDVLERQLIENQKILDNFCGIKKFVAIFPPELAIDDKTLEFYGAFDTPVLIDKSSVTDPSYLIKFKNTRAIVNNRDLTEIIRSYPLELKADRFADHIKSTPGLKDSSPVVTTDAEVFGHHYRERINFLKDLFSQGQFNFIKLAEQSDSQFTSPNSKLRPSSWQTTEADLKNGNPYPYWKDPKNRFQKIYYELADLSYNALKKTKMDSIPSHQFHSAEVHYDKGISSCHPYWLSNNPWWHPDLVEKGARELIKCIRTLPVSKDEKQSAETLYHNFLMNLWHHQWSGKVEKQYHEHDKKHQIFLKSLPKI